MPATADNVLDRQFQADAPNQKWVADFTYMWTVEGSLYVTVVLDLFSLRIVGWSMQSSMTAQLVAGSLGQCLPNRQQPKLRPSLERLNADNQSFRRPARFCP